MSASIPPESSLGYPDRTFTTEVLSCDPNSPVTFTEAAGPSRTSLSAEPFHKASPLISSPITQASLITASLHLQEGHLVSFPSETVYGLGANALSQSASSKIYAAKKRPADNPLIVHVSDLEMLSTLLPSFYNISEAYEVLINAFWPGALTLLFPVDADKPAVPRVVTCGQKSVAVRMPSHPIARALIATSGLPMAGPSANASGRPSPTTAGHVMRDLGGLLEEQSSAAGKDEPKGRLKYILDGGPCAVGVESTVVDGITAEDEIRVLRPGGVTVEQIREVLNKAGLGEKVKLRVYGKDMERSAQQESNPTTPGMKYRHYSPTARVVMLLSARLFGAAVESNTASAKADRTWGSSSAKVVDSLIKNATTSTTTTPQTFASIIQAQMINHLSKRTANTRLNIGIMMTSDSPLSQLVRSSSRPLTPPSSTDNAHPHLLCPLTLTDLPNVTVHPFDLGPSARAEAYARRMFDGLRTLDEGPLLHGAEKCELIFVEALDDAGVGLAVMNRLRKAASETVVLNC
ncbi:related to translation initiation protein SUA5 [Melanopsichium pennsylvanicum]|uniref:Threonylcarbamoyl-AMP synthase n=2 Tax=Melanopsichium pennsylvanicum TaxID=63383 RepID=A0AAJ4XKI1_9BASI|nr:related to translation initiation protein SUA5 [Melanopsichium pennsylvanicum 4]SNX83622.1 related to translation initiation protein SUA5 [Melanopsichium pennsylvanicum]